MKAAYEDFLSRVKSAKNIRIYGAGKFARTLFSLFTRKGVEVNAFVVTDLEKNPSEFCQRPVIGLESYIFQETDYLVVGLENKATMREVVNLLLKREIKNIIRVPYDIIDDIYCNFVMEEESLETFCENLTQENKIIVYVNDLEGEIIVQYMRGRGIQVCAVYTDREKVFLNRQIPKLSSEQLMEADKDSAIILTMGGAEQQRGFVGRLRQMGFERIILLSEKIKNEIKDEYNKVVWEGKNGHYRVIETDNVEKNHYIIQKKQASDIYRWRISIWDHYSYGDEQISAIRNDGPFKECRKMFPDCHYLSCTEVPLSEVDIKDINLEVYMSICHLDKKVKEPFLPKWIIPIQVGKALTDTRIAEVCDDTGDNISAKNTDYSEGTALYWIWKNTSGQDYVGLFHYRRQMVMGKDSLFDLKKFDMVLTVPTYLSMKIKDFFSIHFILEHDWYLMLKYLEEYDKGYYETALAYENAHCYFPCNIFIMRRKYFDEACTFIFGILEKIDVYYKNINLVRKDRYMGYLIENLLNIYLIHNSEKLKTGYTDMKFYYPLEH